MRTLFLWITTALYSQFGMNLTHAQENDYVVMQTNQTLTLLAIRCKTDSKIILEEITTPHQTLPSSWASWIDANAPGHTSWTLTEIDLNSIQVLQCYSFTKSAWIQITQGESPLLTLLTLPLSKVPLSQQRKIGPPPQDGESDFRSVWKPPLVFEGKQIEHPTFDVYQATWPKDASPFSEKTICLYFDHHKRTPFPYFLQIDTAHATGVLRTLDAGNNLPSSNKFLPDF